jgi:hypothetical protein
MESLLSFYACPRECLGQPLRYNAHKEAPKSLFDFEKKHRETFLSFASKDLRFGSIQIPSYKIESGVVNVWRVGDFKVEKK